MASKSLTIKTTLDGDTRRVLLNLDANGFASSPADLFSEITEAVANCFEVASTALPSLKYKDEEGDLCTLTGSTVADFMCLSQCKPGAPMRLYGETTTSTRLEEPSKEEEEAPAVAKSAWEKLESKTIDTSVAQENSSSTTSPEEVLIHCSLQEEVLEPIPAETAELMAMGFPEDAVRAALAAADGKQEWALEHLLAHPQDEQTRLVEAASKPEEPASEETVATEAADTEAVANWAGVCERLLEDDVSTETEAPEVMANWTTVCGRLLKEEEEAAKEPEQEETQEAAKEPEASEPLPQEASEPVPQEETREASEPLPQVVSELMEMGFAEDAVKAALVAAHGSKEWAIEYLLTGRHPTRIDMVAHELRQGASTVFQQVREAGGELKRQSKQEVCKLLTTAKESPLVENVRDQATTVGASVKTRISNLKDGAQEQFHKLDAQLRPFIQEGAEVLKSIPGKASELLKGRGASTNENSSAPTMEAEESTSENPEEAMPGNPEEQGSEPHFTGASDTSA